MHMRKKTESQEVELVTLDTQCTGQQYAWWMLIEPNWGAICGDPDTLSGMSTAASSHPSLWQLQLQAENSVPHNFKRLYDTELYKVQADDKR